MLYSSQFFPPPIYPKKTPLFPCTHVRYLIFQSNILMLLAVILCLKKTNNDSTYLKWNNTSIMRGVSLTTKGTWWYEIRDEGSLYSLYTSFSSFIFTDVGGFWPELEHPFSTLRENIFQLLLLLYAIYTLLPFQVTKLVIWW